MTADRGFRKVLILLFTTIPAHFPFVAMFMLMPTYYMRVIDPKVNAGAITSINPWIIVIGLILMAPLVKKFNVYWSLTVGMLIGGTSFLVLAIPPRFYGQILGIDNVPDMYFAMAIIQIVAFSVSEVIWSPQLQAYVGAISPEGKEGTYMGIGRYPYTTAKLVGGVLFGYLLAWLCPEGIQSQIMDGSLSYWQGPEFMMLIMAACCLLSPTMLLVFKRQFYVDQKAA